MALLLAHRLVNNNNGCIVDPFYRLSLGAQRLQSSQEY